MAYGGALLALLEIQAELSPGREPAPDLLFSHSSKLIGLEHTRLFAEDGGSGSSFQSYERSIDTIAERSQAEYVKRGLPTVEVKLSLPPARPSKARIRELVQWIVPAVQNALPENPGTAEIQNDWSGGMPSEIDSIRMIRFKGQIGTSFFAPRASFIRSIDTKWLQSKIDEKADRLFGYLTRCTEVWLLMVEEQSGLASTLEIPETVYSEPINKRGFARVFLLRRKTEIHELREEY